MPGAWSSSTSGTAGAGASSRAAGIVRTQGGTATAVDLARWTTAFYRGQQDRYGIDSGFRTLGYLILAFDEADGAAARERLAMQHERGLDSRWVDPGEAAQLLPVLDPARITGATWCAEDGAIDPPRNVLAYTVALKAAGVDLRERTAATALRIEGGRVTGVVTAGGTIATERVILAGGVGQRALCALTGGPRRAGRRRTAPDRRDEPPPRAHRAAAADGLRARDRPLLAPGGGRDPVRHEQPARATRRGARGRLGEPAHDPFAARRADARHAASWTCAASGPRRSTTRPTTCRSSAPRSVPGASRWAASPSPRPAGTG